MTQLLAEHVRDIVRDAGGTVVGAARLQKIGYLLSVTGMGPSLYFVYKHYGPYSEDIAEGARYGALFGQITEEERLANWGGSYSVYTVDTASMCGTPKSARQKLAHIAAQANAVELELAATAVFLYMDGYKDAWGETERRKPEKCEDGHLAGAKILLNKLRAIKTKRRLPAFD